MSGERVYLAGPITGLSYDGATDWREEVRVGLAPDIQAISPMRGKDYLAGEDTIADHYETVLSCPKGITTRDRFDVSRVDAVLVNLLGAERVSIGTVMEIAWADAMRIPVILVIEQGNPHQHSMLIECSGFVVGDLEEGIEVVNALLAGEVF